MNDKARKKTTFPFRILPYTRIRAARYGQGLKDPRLREHYCTARMIPCKPNVLDETQEPTAPCHERLQGSGYFLHKAGRKHRLGQAAGFTALATGLLAPCIPLALAVAFKN
jgi:hypothetical protein